MGVRFNKRINLGGGVRINLSKSGVGYSFGGKGFRVTKKAKGGTRTTASIPGTGISYVTESVHKKHNNSNNRQSKPMNVHTTDNNTYDTKEIKNANVKYLVSEELEEMLDAANKSLKYYSWNAIVFWVSLILGFAMPPVWMVSIGAVIFSIYLQKNAIIDLEYNFEDDQLAEVEKRMKPLHKIAKSKKLWYISQSSKVIDKKYSAGASNNVKRNNCKVLNKPPFPFTSNVESVCFKLGKEILLFLPDKLFVFQKGKIGALNYSDVTTSVHGQRFIERESVPRDAKVVDYTWEYVNKSGGPDKRFQNNRKLPICLYGEMEVRSSSGLNTDIMFSNPNID